MPLSVATPGGGSPATLRTDAATAAMTKPARANAVAPRLPLPPPTPQAPAAHKGHTSAASAPTADAGVSVPSLALSLTNSAVNIGVLAVPFAFRLMGLAGGASLLLVLAAAMCVGLQGVLGALRAHASATSLPGLVTSVLGRGAGVATAALLSVSQFGACVVYMLVTVAQLLSVVGHTPLADFPGMQHRPTIVVFITAAIVLPLCLIRDMRYLSSAHFVSLACTTAVELTIVALAYSSLLSQGNLREDVVVAVASPPVSAAAVQAAALLCYTLSIHVSFVPFSATLHTPSPRRLRTSAALAMMGIVAAVLPVGLAGYAAFGATTAGDVVSGNMAYDAAGLACRLLVAVTALLTFAPVFAVLRLAVGELVAPGKDLTTVANQRLFYSITFVLVAAVAVLVTICHSAQAVMGLVGGLCVSLQAFVIPGMLLFRTARSTTWRVVGAALATLGSLFAAVATAGALGLLV